MTPVSNTERVHTVVIGAGQAGLSTGYHLKRRGVPFVILEANERIGDNWRQRWDSLRLFTPALYDSLDGMRFPARPYAFPTKDEMGNYLEAYTARFDLPVRTGTRVERVSRRSDHFHLQTNRGVIAADNVVVAMATFQRPSVPEYGRALDPRIVQLHSIDYRNPAQLQEGPVLIVGAGNSGAEIAMDIAREHPVLMSGRDVGQLPFRIGTTVSRPLARLMLRFLFHRVMTLSTPLGRKVRPKVLYHGGPLIRTRAPDLAAANVERVPRMTGVRNGLPLLEDGRTVEVANVIWCSGFHPGFSWIDIPVFDEHGYPKQHRGVVAERAGLYFVGLHFLYAMSSTMIHGVGRDAAYIARHIAARTLVSSATAPSGRTLVKTAAL